MAYGENFKARNSCPLTAELTIIFEELYCSETNMEERVEGLLQ